MLGASLLKMVKFGFDFTAAEAITLGTGTLVAFFVSILAIKFLMGYIKKHDFKVFGWYRIVLGILVMHILCSLQDKLKIKYYLKNENKKPSNEKHRGFFIWKLKDSSTWT